MYLLVIPGRDTLRCLALATVDEPLPPSKMDLEAADKFVNYEVCVEVISKTVIDIQWWMMKMWIPLHLV